MKSVEVNKNTPTTLSIASKNTEVAFVSELQCTEETKIDFEDVLENIRILLHYNHERG